MPFRDLLLVIDASAKSRSWIELAASLAKEHEAHLACLYILPIPEPRSEPAQTLLDSIIETVIREDRQRGRELRAVFETAVARLGVHGEWRTEGGFASIEAATQARYADLVIVGQRDYRVGSTVMPPLRPEEVALAAGRPVLVLPRVGCPPAIGKRIVLGWNASREATRAANDALPLLTRAEAVTIVVVNPDRKLISAHGEEPGTDIALHLARHGVKAEVKLISDCDGEPGAALLLAAAQANADLIVMGAYGHSRSRELILGGATREALHHMTVPIFLSH